MSHDGFWAAIDAQIAELERASSATEVVTILSHARDPYQLAPDSARAVGRFKPDGPDGYRAKSLPNGPLFPTRTEAEVAELAELASRGAATHSTGGDGFFAGSGGDKTVRDALHTAGWHLVWSEASYYYAMRAPDGSVITYIEGDIYQRDTKGT